MELSGLYTHLQVDLERHWTDPRKIPGASATT